MKVAMKTKLYLFAFPRVFCRQSSAAKTNVPSGRLVVLLVLLALPLLAATAGEPNEQRLQQMLRRFPDADLNKDGKLTPDEARAYLRNRKSEKSSAASAPDRPAAATDAPATATSAAATAGPVQIEIRSDKPVAVNPRVYGTWCEEMFVKDLVDEPEYIAALADLKFKTFLYPGGSISYYHHPRGTGGFNIRPEEVARSRQGEQSRFMKEGSGPDHFEQYIRFVKASGAEALFVANVLNGTVDELDEFLTRLKAERVPIAATILGVEMHLGPGAALGLQGYLDRIKPYLAMLKTKYPEVPIVAHGTPVGRAGARAPDSFHEWNQQLARLPGIGGFSQYGWTEFGGQPRLQTLRSGLTAETPSEAWQQYDEFVRTFPLRQIPAYEKDWGADKKMYVTQWGTHSDRNTAVQGLHIANFYFFMAQYNVAHDNYFAAATSSVNLAQDVSKHARGGGTLYREKIDLLTPYLYTKPFRHLFSGDKKLLDAIVQDVGKNGNEDVVKALAAVGTDGCKYVYLLNSGPAVAVGRLSVDGATLPAGLRVEVESVWSDPASTSGDGTARGASAPAKTFTGERELRELMLEPWSLTVLIMPRPGKRFRLTNQLAP